MSRPRERHSRWQMRTRSFATCSWLRNPILVWWRSIPREKKEWIWLARWLRKIRRGWKCQRWPCGWRMNLTKSSPCISGGSVLLRTPTMSLLALWCKWTMPCCRSYLLASRQVVSIGPTAQTGSVRSMSSPQDPELRRCRHCQMLGALRFPCLGSRLLRVGWCWRSSFPAAQLSLRAPWRWRMRCSRLMLCRQMLFVGGLLRLVLSASGTWSVVSSFVCCNSLCQAQDDIIEVQLNSVWVTCILGIQCTMCAKIAGPKSTRSLGIASATKVRTAKRSGKKKLLFWLLWQLADHTGEVDRVLVNGDRLQLPANTKTKAEPTQVERKHRMSYVAGAAIGCQGPIGCLEPVGWQLTRGYDT